MKNIHVLSTDKPSRLYLNTQEYIFEEECSLSTDECQNKHIYITSDEELKERDWCFDITENIVVRCLRTSSDSYWNKNCKKIILTTDQDLIKDGVQAVGDEFLEWFVKNPSCEDIDWRYSSLMKDCEYEIIIPKEEEDFKHELYVMSKEEVMANRSNAYEFIDFNKQETIEEASQIEGIHRASQHNMNRAEAGYNAKWFKRGAIFGAKWQQEQILDFLHSEITERRDYSASKMCEKVIEFIEQFKNK